jgi:glutaconate CoA-transferase subunit B
MSPSCTPAEIMATVLARDVRDWETVGCGTHSPVPAAALLLALHTHAPHATLIIEGHPEHSLATPSDLHFIAQRGELDLYHFSGIQIDRRGNLNMTLLGDPANPKLRVPGAHGAPVIYYTARRSNLFRMEHTRRSLVERVDFVTCSGTAACERGGPNLLVTPNAVFRFDRERSDFVLISFHGGLTLEEVCANVGWDVSVAPEVRETEPPSPAELRLLRTAVREQVALVYPDFVRQGHFGTA